MLLLWLSKIWVFKFPCASSNALFLLWITTERFLIPLSVPLLISQIAITQTPVYKLYFKNHQLTCLPSKNPPHILDRSVKVSHYLLYDPVQHSRYRSDMDLYSTVHGLWLFISFLIISTNLFSPWSQQPTEPAFSPTGQPFALFNWFPLLIACQSISLPVLSTDTHVTLWHHISSWLLSKTVFKQNVYFSGPVTLK